MKSYKRKEYVLTLILLYTSVTFCNPCVNQTLSAIPYPSDCQAFVLCWLSHAYLQTCPSGLFFDIKNNNCQPLVKTTCCNVTLPILIIPVPIYQGSTVPTNKTNIWTATSAKQTNSSSTTPLLTTLKTNSTFVTHLSRIQPEATTSIISILSTESSDSSQSSEFTLHVTEQKEITTHLEPANIDIDETKSNKAVNSSQPNLYKTSTITSTDIAEATTPIESTLWTYLRLTSLSGFTLNTTEKVITTPQTSTFVSELAKSEESKKTKSSAFVTSTNSSNKTQNSTLITSTNPAQPITPIIFTLWREPTDSSEIPTSSDYTLNVELSTTLLETTNTYTDVTKKQSKQTNVGSTPPPVSSTEYSNCTSLISTLNRNLPSVATFNPLNTEGTHTSAMSTISTDTIISSKTFPIITSDSFGTEPQTFTESSTWRPLFSSQVNMPSSLNSSFFPTKYSTSGAPKSTQYYRNKTPIISLSSLSENTQAPIAMVMPTFSTDFTERNEHITRSTPIPVDKPYSLPERTTDNINFLTSSRKLSTDNYSTIIATLATESQIFTESSTLQPLVSASANIVYSKKIPYFPTIIYTKRLFTLKPQIFTDTSTLLPTFSSTKNIPSYSQSSSYLTSSTKELDGLSTHSVPQYTENSLELLSSTQDFFSTLEIFNKTELLTTTERSLTAVTAQSLSSQFISSTNSQKSDTTFMKYDIESPSTTLESFPISTEEKIRSAVTMESSISTTEPTISTETNLHTDSETQSTISEEFKSIHSTLLPDITIFTSKSMTSSTDTTTVKPIVTQIVRTLPPLPYSPPPCVLATTTQKSIISEKTLPNIPIVTSTYIAPEISTHSSFSKPLCGFWDKFVFPDESDCKHYYKCLFSGIRKVSCRYGYEFNPYALKCMPHLEANCQRRKSSRDVLDFLHYIMKLNNLSANGPTEHYENNLDKFQEIENDITK